MCVHDAITSLFLIWRRLLCKRRRKKIHFLNKFFFFAFVIFDLHNEYIPTDSYVVHVYRFSIWIVNFLFTLSWRWKKNSTHPRFGAKKVEFQRIILPNKFIVLNCKETRSPLRNRKKKNYEKLPNNESFIDISHRDTIFS